MINKFSVFVIVALFSLMNTLADRRQYFSPRSNYTENAKYYFTILVRKIFVYGALNNLQL